MGYSKHRRAVLRNKPQLDILYESPTTVRFPTQDPKKLAYKINEALFASQFHAEFAHYAPKIKPLYMFKARENELIAERILDGEVKPSNLPNVSAPLADTTAKKSRETHEDIEDLIGVMVLARKTEAVEVHFPNVHLLDDEKKRLKAWADEHDWKYIDHDGAGLTLTVLDVPEEILWREPEIISEEVVP